MSIKIGLVGTGTVGGGCIDVLQTHHDDFARDLGLDLELARVCSLIPEQAEAHHVSDIFTLDYHDLINDPEIQIIIELIGGTTIAKSIICEALEAGKHVVTANKALLARAGDEILTRANEFGLEVAFEASIGGGIPIIRPLMHSLTANSIISIMGIVNGTTNYMLTRMDEGFSYAEALAEAQSKGYAEADPTADVDGLDAAAKIAILSSIAYKSLVTIDDVATQGIRTLDAIDLKIAKERGCCIKLLAIGNNTKDGVDVRVHPSMLPAEHPLSQVKGVMNAIYVVGDFVGETMYYGAGAGSHPTASAVISDVIEIARNIECGGGVRLGKPWSKRAAFVSQKDAEFSYYLRLPVSLSAAFDVQVFAKKAGFVLKEAPCAYHDQASGIIHYVMFTEPAAYKTLEAALNSLTCQDGLLMGTSAVIRMVD